MTVSPLPRSWTAPALAVTPVADGWGTIVSQPSGQDAAVTGFTARHVIVTDANPIRAGPGPAPANGR